MNAHWHSSELGEEGNEQHEVLLRVCVCVCDRYWREIGIDETTTTTIISTLSILEEESHPPLPD